LLTTIIINKRILGSINHSLPPLLETVFPTHKQE